MLRDAGADLRKVDVIEEVIQIKEASFLHFASWVTTSDADAIRFTDFFLP
jgi:hypothetical protein